MSVGYAAFGEMAVTVEGARTPLRRRRERGVLAVLLVARGAPVPAERLAAEVWGGEAQAGLAPVQVAVSRLRSVLDPSRTARSGSPLTSTAAGYLLRADDDDVDTWAFEAAADACLATEDPAARLAAADRALALWTAEPYPGEDAPSVRSETDRLTELKLVLLEHRARALVDLGRPEEAQRSLADLAPRHPYRERTWALLALAEYQCSRQADALTTLRTLRERLADELGVDPSPEVQRLEQAVLQQDSSLDSPAPAPAPAAPRPAPLRRPTPGRDQPLAVALAQVAEAIESRGTRFVLVAGEPGIGKSRLVQDLADAATGTQVLVGRCLDGDYAPALYPWLDVVRRLAGDDPDPQLAPLLSGEPVAPSGGAGTTLRMFDAVVDLLGSSGPLVVVLEDVHWADATSLQLLRHLAAAPPASPLTVVCTRRTTEARTSDELVEAMASLARAGAERLRLDGLDADSVRTLLDGSVGAHDARLDAFVTEVTGGNPFFVLQYARLIAATPHADPADLPVPDGIRDVLRQRLGRLPDDAVRLLSSASVLGRTVDPEVLADLVSTPVDHCLDQLDLALAGGLVEEEGAAYAFVHALARETVYAELSAARRMRLHDRAGRVLERHRPGDADAIAEIAHHAHVAAPLGAEHAARACEWHCRAATVAASRNGHAEALGLWQLVLVDSPPDSLMAATAHRGSAAALIRLGRMGEANGSLDQALAIASAHEAWDMVAEATRVLSGAGPWSWREHGVVHEPSVRVLTEALDHVDLPLRAQLLSILQMEHFYSWQTSYVEDYGRQSVELAREVGDPELLRNVLMLRLIASTGSWEAQERLELVEELLDLDPAGEVGVTALFYLGQIRRDCGDLAGADEAMARCTAAAASLRHSGLDIPLGFWHSARARDRDDPDAAAVLQAMLERHRAVGYVASRELESLADIRREPVHGGTPVSEATVALAEQSGMPLRALVAHALLESGDGERAHALLGPPAPDSVVDFCSTAGRCLRLLVLSETGTDDEVREALRPLEGRSGSPVSYGTIDHLGAVDHFLAAAYARLGDERALPAARRAAELNVVFDNAPWRRRSEALVARLERSSPA